MGKYVIAALFAALAAACPLQAGEETSPSADRAQQLGQSLDGLKGMDGLHGGNTQDMQLFLSQVQTPQMVEVVDRLSKQITAGSGEIDLNAIDQLVRSALTKEDMEKLLGHPVTDEEFRKAVDARASQEQMQEMLQLLLQQSATQ